MNAIVLDDFLLNLVEYPFAFWWHITVDPAVFASEVLKTLRLSPSEYAKEHQIQTKVTSWNEVFRLNIESASRLPDDLVCAACIRAAIADALIVALDQPKMYFFGFDHHKRFCEALWAGLSLAELVELSSPKYHRRLLRLRLPPPAAV